MKFSNIPTYNDPVDFVDNEEIKYPCNTQFMIYNPLVHKYFLTKGALEQAGLDVDRRYVTNALDKKQDLINKATEKVYNYIRYKCGLKLIQINEWRIATAHNQMYNKYEARKQFEQALLYEAEWLVENSNSAKYSINDTEKGVVDKQNPDEDYWDLGDISTETRRILHFMGLDKWFSIGQYRRLNTDEY